MGIWNWLGHPFTIIESCQKLMSSPYGAGTCSDNGWGVPRWVALIFAALVLAVAVLVVWSMNQAFEQRIERNRRLYLGLCLYCGEDEHRGNCAVVVPKQAVRN